IATQKLNSILEHSNGKDSVTLHVNQTDGRTFRAELPVTVDAADGLLHSELFNLFNRQIWQVK
ncbi:MAG: hypothetical protein IJV62_02310, partial [Eggerthellaceae bacterium]|nr:hypothetical protein [Eggerthellaceae bacterium]